MSVVRLVERHCADQAVVVSPGGCRVTSILSTRSLRIPGHVLMRLRCFSARLVLVIDSAKPPEQSCDVPHGETHSSDSDRLAFDWRLYDADCSRRSSATALAASEANT